MKKLVSLIFLGSLAFATTPSYETAMTLANNFKAKGYEIKEFKKLKSEIPNFDKYLLGVVIPLENKEVRRYIWVSKDGKYVILALFEKKGSKFVPIQPKKSVVEINEKRNLEFVKKIEKTLKENNIPYTIGNGKKEIYMLWDVFCPFCHEYLRLLKNSPEMKDYTIKLIPFPIHGEMSLKGFTYLTWYSQNYGWDKYQKEYMNINYGKYKDKLLKDIQTKYKEIPQKVKEKYEKIFKQMKEELVKAGMRGTPTVIKVKEKGENWQGCVNIGAKHFKDFEKWCESSK